MTFQDGGSGGELLSNQIFSGAYSYVEADKIRGLGGLIFQIVLWSAQSLSWGVRRRILSLSEKFEANWEWAMARVL